jgi:hypothetical protein
MTKSRSKQNKNAPPKQSKRQIKEIYKKKKIERHNDSDPRSLKP